MARAARACLASLVWLGLAAAGWSDEAVATPQKKPTFRVESTTVDAGLVLAGREAEAVFVFHNDGDTPVKIVKAKPT